MISNAVWDQSNEKRTNIANNRENDPTNNTKLNELYFTQITEIPSRLESN